METNTKEIESPEQYLLDTGLLFQINRTLLHPLGLSLYVLDEETPFYQDSPKIQKIRLVATDNPNGFVFGESELIELHDRFNTFITSQHDRVMGRAEKLGFIMQPTPDNP